MTDPTERLRTALAGSYAIEREVGSGGMAAVYLAEDAKHRRKVAVKVLRPDLAATLGPERFLREIEIAAQLHHPHILPLYDSGQQDGILYYVMPYEEGQSLRERLLTQRELPIGEAVRILRDVADALAYAHQHGVVQRDIKPENIMLSGRHALVTDFGVAKAVSEATGREQLTTAGVALGTPTYMAPEQAAADPHIDHRADIYALGVVAYELLTGHPPFQGGTAQQVLSAHMTQRPEALTRFRDTAPPALAALVMRCLEKKPADRWQSAPELVPQLEALATPSGGITPTGTQPAAAVDYTTLARRSHPARAGALYGLASVGVLALVYFLVMQLGLPDWVFAGAIGLLAIGLPVTLITGHQERRRALARVADPTSSGDMPEAGRDRFTWRRALAAGAVGFGALTLGTAGYTAMRALGIGPAATLLSAGTLERNDRLLLADFVNRTPDSTLGLSLATALRIDLAESPAFQLVDVAAITQALSRAQYATDTTLTNELALILAEREGFEGVITGEVAPLGGGYVISATVVSTADRATQVAVRETADDEASVIVAVDRLSKRLRERIGESLRTIRESEGLPQVTTPSLEALRLYALASRAAEQDLDQAGAVALLEEALTHDTAFAMAYRKLGTMLLDLGREPDRRNEAITRAFNLRERVTNLERYHIVAMYRWVVQRDLEGAIEAYRALYQVAPANAANNLGYFYELSRNWAAAEEVYLEGIAARPDYPRIRSNLLNAQFAAGKVDAARATLDSLIARFPDYPRSVSGPIQFAGGIRDFDEWERLVRTFQADHREPGQQAYASQQLSMVARVRGQVRAADRHLRERLAVLEQQDRTIAALMTSLDLAWSHARFRNDNAQASALMEETLRRYPLDGVPVADRPLFNIAVSWAEFGHPDRARAVLAEYESGVDPAIQEAQPGQFQVRGAIALAEGRPADALEQFRRWDREMGCPICALPDLARTYDALGEPDSALAVYQRYVDTPYIFHGPWDAWELPMAYKRLGELYEERGDRERALRYSGDFVDLWTEADAELQAVVRELRDRIARLVAEG